MDEPTIREKVQRLKTSAPPVLEGFNGKRGILVHHILGAMFDENQRRLVQGWVITGGDVVHRSAKDLTHQDVAALWEWVQPHKDDDMGWLVSTTFNSEGRYIAAFLEASYKEMISRITGMVQIEDDPEI